jgi:hypothetical protein
MLPFACFAWTNRALRFSEEPLPVGRSFRPIDSDGMLSTRKEEFSKKKTFPIEVHIVACCWRVLYRVLSGESQLVPETGSFNTCLRGFFS